MKLSRLTALLVASLFLASLALADSAPQAALLITRLSSQQWQLRLIGGGSGERYSGVVESSAPFMAVNGSAPRNFANAKLWSPASLGATLTPGTDGSDRVSFEVGSDSQLCLRDTGSSGIRVYLGDRLQDAIPVSAPVALTRADACGDTVVAKPQAGTKKYHPGHYIALLPGYDSQSVMATSIKPGVVGFLKRYEWPALETSPGVYQLAEIQSDLAWTKAHGMQLIVLVADKSFNKQLPTPPDLDKYAIKNHGGGYTTLRWMPVVAARFQALVTAVGAKFDSTSSFEGMATEETAPGLYYPLLKKNGYTPQEYSRLLHEPAARPGEVDADLTGLLVHEFLPGNPEQYPP